MLDHRPGDLGHRPQEWRIAWLAPKLRFMLTKVVALLRYSYRKETDKDLEFKNQRFALEAAAPSRGWEIVHWVPSVTSTKKSYHQRPDIMECLDGIADGKWQGIVAADFDRMFRNLVEYITIKEQADDEGWIMEAVTSQYDWSDPYQEASALTAMVWAQAFRKITAQRVNRHHDRKRAEGKPYGNQPYASDELISRILKDHVDGFTNNETADRLNADVVPTLRKPGTKLDGSQWDVKHAELWNGKMVWRLKDQTRKRLEKKLAASLTEPLSPDAVEVF